METGAVKLENIRKSYQEKTVLSGFSAEFPYGKCSVLMGMSGLGKTTLLHIMMGLEKQDGGTVTGVPEKMAAVFQEDRLCRDFTAFTNVKMATEAKKEEILSVFSNLLIADAAQKKVKELSGGMKRRVAIARAVLSDSDIIFLDEPFKGLDETSKKAAAQLLLETGKTMIMVTHDRSEADLMNAEVTVLS